MTYGSFNAGMHTPPSARAELTVLDLAIHPPLQITRNQTRVNPRPDFDKNIRFKKKPWKAVDLVTLVSVCPLQHNSSLFTKLWSAVEIDWLQNHMFDTAGAASSCSWNITPQFAHDYNCFIWAKFNPCRQVSDFFWSSLPGKYVPQLIIESKRLWWQARGYDRESTSCR